MDAHRVSVILPTHNRARSLGDAVASVLAQSHADLELIVVDDGSTDDTPAVLSAIPDPRLVVLRTAENRGASHARNAGLARARGAWVSFMDSDDAWHPRKLERQMAAMRDAGAGTGWCVCSMEVERGGKRHAVRYADEEVPGPAAAARIVGGMGVGTPCWLVRREVMDAAGGFDESLPRMQDYECALRLAARAGVRLMSETLVTARIGDDSLSASADRYARAIERIVEKHRGLFEENRAGYSRMIFRAGKYLAIEGRHAEALAWFRRAWRIHPANHRALVAMVLVATGAFPLLRRFKYTR